MTFWVYENWTAEDKAKIHRAECSDCNNGSGKHPGASDDHGRWHGPFPTFSEANDTASRTGRPVSNCKHCTPH